MTNYDLGHGSGNDVSGIAVPGEQHGLTDATGGGELYREPPRPINWNRLTADEPKPPGRSSTPGSTGSARTYGLPAAVIPAAWHRHPELVWELSRCTCTGSGLRPRTARLRTHRLAPRLRRRAERLRDWVASCGTNLERTAPPARPIWPGEPPDDDGLARSPSPTAKTTSSASSPTTCGAAARRRIGCSRHD